MSSVAARKPDSRVTRSRATGIILLVATLVLLGGFFAPPASAATVSSAELSGGWALRSATGLADTGATISQVGYSTTAWSPVSLPSTVLAGLSYAPRALGYPTDGVIPTLKARTGARLPAGFVQAIAEARGFYTAAGMDSGMVSIGLTAYRRIAPLRSSPARRARQ